ncbi:resuscitation-promoting factor Rpf1 domain-containing protein [Corynebacterium anserum]|uniref:DUF3235 domain-containing protein n=1 Tax=Corynebacterium anserum TaxID=2684406 RepID=A0A7G7YM86_9CORY|nr:resuscitation-promoting factor Rpf1 domain-containing protein [Corynebacterium anserum]MBC2680962.1 DUF3235 domain-containing protein [Corynebacterium anserum]QNH95606.1 DUF3235 domain-containing protein [Corynebacterium anserum]
MGRHSKRNSFSTTSRMAVAGVALAGASAMLTPAAQAAPDSDWDRLAQCESGGNWHINTGNGFSGGLQFHPQTWNGFGGQEFAPMAYQASREEQIVVGERVLAAQGWGAWPACSAKLGLNSAPTPRTAPGAPVKETKPAAAKETTTPASAAEKATKAANGAKDSDVEAMYKRFVTTIEGAGYTVPQEVKDYYANNSGDLDSLYSQVQSHANSIATGNLPR